VISLYLQVSIISLAAEMYICRRIADDTNGTYGTILDAKHFEDLLMAQVAPPPTIASNVSQARPFLGA
jgi:transcription initiation factor TFIIH subunit 2